MNPITSITSPSPFRFGNAVLVALLLALFAAAGCSESGNPGGNQGVADSDYEERRFQFVRAGKLILRLDSQLGVVWKVDENGDGAWVMLGATPDDDGEPNWNGRYALFSLKPSGFGGPPRLLRSDRATGRSWLALADDESRWSPIREGGGGHSSSGETSSDSSTKTAGGEGGDKNVDLPVVSKATIEASPGDEAEKLEVVVQALEKEGLPVEIKVWAASQLAVFPPDDAVPPLLDALKSEHPEVVIAAIHSLKTIGRAITIPKIMALSQHPDPAVRAAVQAVVVPVP